MTPRKPLVSGAPRPWVLVAAVLCTAGLLASCVKTRPGEGFGLLSAGTDSEEVEAQAVAAAEARAIAAAKTRVAKAADYKEAKKAEWEAQQARLKEQVAAKKKAEWEEMVQENKAKWEADQERKREESLEANRAEWERRQAENKAEFERQRAEEWRARRLRPNWEPLLTEEELQRGLTYYGSGAGLRRFAAKLLEGEPVKVVSVGGSVTAAGGSAYRGESYLARFFQALKESFPYRNHTLDNKGMGAWNSARFEPCIDRTVPEDTDLVILEFAINDLTPSQPFISFDSPERRAYESILRHLLRAPNRPAILLLQVYPWNQAAGDGVKQGLYYREPEAQLSLLGQYYDIPSVSLRAAAYHLMRLGVDGFRVDKVTRGGAAATNIYTRQVIPVAPEEEAHKYFYYDSVHPAAPGLMALAELAIAPVNRAIEEEAARLNLTRRHDPRLEELPPPMIPNSPELTTSFCAMLEDFEPLAVSKQGFKYQAERPDAETYVEQKWGWSGTRPGAWVELEADTRLEGKPLSKLATIDLTYLMSYENMGVAEVTCRRCECEPTRFNAQEQKGVSVFLNHEFQATQHETCRIRVTILDRPKENPEELHKIMLAALMIRSID